MAFLEELYSKRKAGCLMKMRRLRNGCANENEYGVFTGSIDRQNRTFTFIKNRGEGGQEEISEADVVYLSEVDLVAVAELLQKLTYEPRDIIVPGSAISNRH